MEIVLIGAGGHAKSCIACIETTQDTVRGCLDAARRKGETICGYRVLGGDGLIPELALAGCLFIVAIGQIASPEARIAAFERITIAGGKFATVVSRDAIIARTAGIGDGTIVLSRTAINSDARIGRNCIINTAAVIEHDAIIDDHVHVSTGAIINGNCSIGSGCFIGSGAVLRNGVAVGPNVVVGAGSVVVKNIIGPGVYAGNPAALLKTGKSFDRDGDRT
jgi:sugar O-acyltransferase (sialic acid O-acetyltransferase NeuD family)